MRNRAKCRKCNSIIESYHSEDHVICKCDEIEVYGGAAMRCAAKDFANFLRVDDEGNEIIVSVKDKDDVKPLDIGTKPTKEDLLKMLDEMIKNIDAMPTHIMTEPITHYDFVSALLLISSILRS